MTAGERQYGAVIVDPKNQRTQTDGIWAAGEIQPRLCKLVGGALRAACLRRLARDALALDLAPGESREWSLTYEFGPVL